VSSVGIIGLGSISFFFDLARETLPAYERELRFAIALLAAICASLPQSALSYVVLGRI
jgi:hypothetical protein